MKNVKCMTLFKISDKNNLDVVELEANINIKEYKSC